MLSRSKIRQVEGLKRKRSFSLRPLKPSQRFFKKPQTGGSVGAETELSSSCRSHPNPSGKHATEYYKVSESSFPGIANPAPSRTDGLAVLLIEIKMDEVSKKEKETESQDFFSYRPVRGTFETYVISFHSHLADPMGSAISAGALVGRGGD